MEAGHCNQRAWRVVWRSRGVAEKSARQHDRARVERCVGRLAAVGRLPLSRNGEAIREN